MRPSPQENKGRVETSTTSFCEGIIFTSTVTLAVQCPKVQALIDNINANIFEGNTIMMYVNDSGGRV